MYTDPSGHVFTIGMAMLIGALVGGVSAGIQTNWDIGAMVSGAIIGAAAGAVGFGAGGWAANSGLGTAIGSNLAGGLVGGAAAGATAGFLGTMANGGGKFFKNTLNGAFFGAVAGAVTGGMLDLQIIEINDVVASMAGAFTSGTMKGGFDDGIIAMAYAAGAAAVSYAVKGSMGEVKAQRSEEIKLYAASDIEAIDENGIVSEAEYNNSAGIEQVNETFSTWRWFKRLLGFGGGGVSSRVIGGAAGAGVKALDVGVWKDFDQAALRKIAIDCVGSGACDVTIYEMLNNYPASRQQIIDAIKQSGYRRRP